jgi:hypothetical protein
MEQSYTTIDPWTCGDSDALGVDVTRALELVGFEVEAIDGEIGKIDEATHEVGSSYVIVDTSPLLFAKRVIPAGVIQRVELGSKRIYVDRAKEEIKNAPELDETMYRDEEYRSQLWAYYERERNTAAL